MSFVDEEFLPTGVYNIINVRFGTSIAVPPRQKNLCGSYRLIDFKWHVTCKSNDKFGIRTVRGNFFAQCEPRSRAGNMIFVQPEDFEWVIKQVSPVTEPDCYLIYSTMNPRLLWSLPYGEDETPLEFARVESNNRNWWKFKKVETEHTPSEGGVNVGLPEGPTLQRTQGALTPGACGDSKGSDAIEPLSLTPTDLNKRAEQLAEKGLLHDALEASQNAVRLQRAATSDDSTTSKAALATFTQTLSNRLRAMEHQRESLDVIKESVELRRGLVKEGGRDSEEDLASSLNDLSLRYDCLCYRDEALDTVKEAVDIRRQIARDGQDVLNPNLAMSYDTYSKSLRAIGRYEEALDEATRSVQMFRACIRRTPGRYEKEFVSSLNSFSKCLCEMRRLSDAVKVSEEAVAIADSLRSNGQVELAESLEQHASCLLFKVHPETALQVVERAVRIRRHLAKDLPENSKPDLASSLVILSRCLGQIDRLVQSMDAAKEGVRLYRDFIRYHSIERDRTLPIFIHDLSFALIDSGRLREALQTARESVNSLRELADEYPLLFKPSLSFSLMHLSGCYYRIGAAQLSLQFAQEASSIIRKCSQDRPGFYAFGIGSSLSTLARALAAQGQLLDGLAAARGAIDIGRDLIHEDPEAYLASYGRWLVELANYLTTGQQEVESLKDVQQGVQILKEPSTPTLGAIQEAVKLSRDLARDYPEAFSVDLAINLELLSGVVYSMGYYQDSWKAKEEANEIRQTQAKRQYEMPVGPESDISPKTMHQSYQPQNTHHTLEPETRVQPISSGASGANAGVLSGPAALQSNQQSRLYYSQPVATANHYSLPFQSVLCGSLTVTVGS